MLDIPTKRSYFKQKKLYKEKKDDLKLPSMTYDFVKNLRLYNVNTHRNQNWFLYGARKN